MAPDGGGEAGTGGGGILDTISNFFGGGGGATPVTPSDSLSPGLVDTLATGSDVSTTGGASIGGSPVAIPFGGSPAGSATTAPVSPDIISAPLAPLSTPSPGAAPGAAPAETPAVAPTGPTSAVTAPAAPTPSPVVDTLSTGGPGAGLGPTGGPGGGAAAIAAPANIDTATASPGVTFGSNMAPSGSTFSDSAAINTNLGQPSAPATGGEPGFFSKGGTLDTIASSPITKIGVPAAGLLFNYLQQQKQPQALTDPAKSVTPLVANAQQSQAASTALESPLTKAITSGQPLQLPPGLQAGIDQAAEAAKAQIRSRYANVPGQSSAMEQELAAVDMNAASTGSQIALQLFSQGASLAQVSNQVYESLLQQSLQTDQNLQNAVGNFATAVANSSRPAVNLVTA